MYPLRLARRILRGSRGYHDESFGFRKPREHAFPDYTPAQLKNRADLAPLLRYVDAIRTHGHRAARIDPLDLIHREEVAALDPRRYGLDNDSEAYNVNGILWTQPVETIERDDSDENLDLNLRQITKDMRRIYLGSVGYEYMHLPSKTERLWFSHTLESGPTLKISLDMQTRIAALLARSEVFDNFLQLKFPNLKRYGLEGAESMLPALDMLFLLAANAGVENIILGMPHRGRLNLLTGLLKYPLHSLFTKITGGSEFPAHLGAEGDVLSHMVASPRLEHGVHPDSHDGVPTKSIKVSLLPNPSHLEAVNPVAMGKTRAKQYSLLKTSPEDCSLGDKVMCVQLHGDASFAGQGVVMESLGLSNLPHFTIGGSIHIVVDNNIGYTTPATGARSSLYCSDVGKMINAPILHVNGDHPEDVVSAMDIAFKYRNFFRKDIIVDLLVYRRCHNELDLPNLTSPLMYEKISSRPSVPQLYEEHLRGLGVSLTGATRTEYYSYLDEALKGFRNRYESTSPVQQAKWKGTAWPPKAEGDPETGDGEQEWKGMVWPASAKAQGDPETGIREEELRDVGKASVTIPHGFEIHPKLKRHINNRLISIESGTGIDWSTAEAMAFGSLLREGFDVRLSGQDVGRGTFSQRHAMLVNQKTEGVVVPLNEALNASGKLELANSSLSEMAVLGFEYGASWERPTLLPIWEAQFGDFFNGAQVIIDTYISSAETKWLKQSGIVLLLPHGLDGAGPEHSSSRIERMLQLTNDRYTSDEPAPNINMHVTFPTTPAQYFHLLRRQMKRNYRKPLIVAGPKALLRLAAAASRIGDFGLGTRFQPVLRDPAGNTTTAKRVVLMTGKIYYELFKERQERGLEKDVAFIRVEELAPFPFNELRDVLKEYENIEEVGWLQEEPKNQGAYGHVGSRLVSVMGELGLERAFELIARKESALPAPGIGDLYRESQKRVIESAFEKWGAKRQKM